MDLIDTSVISLSIAGVLAIISILLSKYYLDRRQTEDSENKMESTTVWMYSLIIGLVVGILSLILYKQFMIYRGNNELMTDGFYE